MLDLSRKIRKYREDRSFALTKVDFALKMLWVNTNRRENPCILGFPPLLRNAHEGPMQNASPYDLGHSIAIAFQLNAKQTSWYPLDSSQLLRADIACSSVGFEPEKGACGP